MSTSEQQEAAGMIRGRARRAIAPERTTHAVEPVEVKDPRITRYTPVTTARM
jgi:hypothetical protein